MTVRAHEPTAIDAVESHLQISAAAEAQRRCVPILADWKLVTTVLIVTLLWTNIPYVYAGLTSPPDREFLGLVYNVPDIGQYFAWMRASQEGFLISNVLTSEPNAPAFFNFVFWLLGRLALHTGLALPQVFGLFRLFSGALFILVAYYFCSIVLEDLAQRRTAFLLIVFSSGLAAFAIALDKIGLNLEFKSVHVAEGTTLYTIMAFPLLTFGMALVTLIFAWTLCAYVGHDLKYAVAAGVAAFVLGWSHGYDLILVYVVLAVFTLTVLLRNGWHGKALLIPAIVIGLSAWPSLYFFFLTRTNPVWRQVLAQFVNAGVFSPPPLELLALLGIPLLLALVTFDGLLPLKRRGLPELLVKTWFGVNFFLIYLPVEYQIHFINGWQIPICVLATIGLYKHLWPRVQAVAARLGHSTDAPPERLSPPPERLSTPPERLSTLRSKGVRALFNGALLLLVLPTNVYYVAWRTLDMSRHQAPYFLLRDELAALAWLDDHTTWDDVVLSSLEFGQFVPGLAGTRAYLAHWANTLKFLAKREQVRRFYSSTTSDAERRALVERNNIRYVFWGESEQRLGDWDPSTATWLSLVWVSPRARVYTVRPSPHE